MGCAALRPFSLPSNPVRGCLCVSCVMVLPIWVEKNLLHRDTALTAHLLLFFRLFLSSGAFVSSLSACGGAIEANHTRTLRSISTHCVGKSVLGSVLHRLYPMPRMDKDQPSESFMSWCCLSSPSETLFAHHDQSTHFATSYYFYSHHTTTTTLRRR
jgi:hypothetical protein